ncbi:MAG: TIM barrel protein [Deinococcales bacterium]
MRHCIATVSLSGHLREKLQAVALAGFDAVEIFENDLLSFEGRAGVVREMASDLGLEILMFQPFRDFEGLPEPQRSKALDRAERKFDVMQELGTDLLLVCSNLSPLALPGLDRAAEDLFELGERAKKRQLRIGFEGLAWARYLSDYRDCWEVVRRANHEQVGIILDSFHVLSRGLELKSLSLIPADKIFYVHLADAPSFNMDLLSWSRHFRCLPGQGNLPLKDFMRALQHVRYHGTISLEIFNDQFRASSAHSVALDAKRSLLFLEETLTEQKIEQKVEQKGKQAPNLYQGIEFIEFALNETIAPKLETMLKALGFQHWGNHRSKQVRVWRQGEIHLVINCEPEGFPYSYNLLHGSAVAAIAFRVSDLTEALERAAYYRCLSFKQAHLTDEANLSAIETLEGGLIYFVGLKQNIWQQDFDLLPYDETKAHLIRIDHLAQVTAFERLSSWLLFYRSVFAFEAESLLEIADTSGLVQSQVVKNADKSIRIVLNGSQSQHTLVGRFLAEYLGGGVQHIAFESQDIFVSLEAMRAQGMELLPIPENYYDDLEAKYNLNPELLARLKEHHILYDQHEDGYFFHAYSHSFDQRFFFEFSQRHDYEGFGAINAPIRLAAQQRFWDKSS